MIRNRSLVKALSLPLLTVILTILVSASAQPALAAQTISVKTFGAKGDGVTDDQVAIQNAFNAASQSGATVLFPRGFYLHSSDLNANSIAIKGDQASLIATTQLEPRLVLDGNCSVSDLRILANQEMIQFFPAIVSLPSSTQTKLSRLTFVSGFHNCVHLNGNNATVSECNFASDFAVSDFLIAEGDRILVNKCNFYGNKSLQDQEGIVFGDTTNFRVTASNFYSLSLGVMFHSLFGGPSRNVQIDSNKFVAVDNGLRVFNDTENLTVNNNQFLNNVAAIRSDDGDIVNALIDSNRFVNSTKESIVLNNFSFNNAGRCEGVQISRNTILNSGSDAVILVDATRTVIRENTITNAGAQGIRVSKTATSLTIDRNKLINCGLVAGPVGQAVILVGGTKEPSSGSVAINRNNYQGNSSNLQFFVRSFPSATTLSGNTTSTLLPSKVGP